MAAAAAAAKGSQVWVGEPSGGSEVAVVLSLAVVGGLVEGLALGTAQALGLSGWLSRRRRVGWVLVTLAVAGIGWAAASAPAAIAGEGGAQPSLAVIVVGAIGIGVVMGAVLGLAQTLVLRGLVRHPWRWVAANLAAWALAMPVVFVGATTAGADWSVLAVVGWGAVTGVVAGAVLGLVSGWLLPSVNGPSPQNRVVLALLSSPMWLLLPRSLLGLRVRGAMSGSRFTLPVVYAADEGGLVVFPGHAEKKRWWRNLRGGAPVEVLLHGTWMRGYAEALEGGDAGYEVALLTYQRRWPRVRHLDEGPVVRIRLPRQPF